MFKKMIAQINSLMNEAESLLNEGKIAEARAKREEAESIQNKLEEAKLENANLEAMKNKAPSVNLENESVGLVGGKIMDKTSVTMNQEDVISSETYKNAFLKHLQGKELTQLENATLTTGAGSVGTVIPETTQNKILEAVVQYAPLLAEVELLRVPGGVTIPVEDVVAAAAKHTEGATITADADTITYVDLFGYEITKLLTISKSVKKMSISAFENWLVSNLSRSLGNQITKLIISGTGTGEATGIDTLTWDASNSITVAKASSMTAQDALNVIALLPGGYDAGAKFLMSKKTLFQDFMPLQDKSKNDLVQQEGKNYFIQGYPVMLDDRMTIHEAILGDFMAGYKANMPEDVNVTSAFDLKTNSFDYLGAGMFDGKPAIPNAFVKIVKATV